MSAFIPTTFVQFQAEAIKRGYNPIQWSSTQFILKTPNGMRCEFMNSRGGKFGFGYRCNPKTVQFLYKHIKEQGKFTITEHNVTHNNPLLPTERRGSFNLRATNLTEFFDLVDYIAAMVFPVVSSAAPAAAVPAPVKLIKAVPALPAAKPLVKEMTAEELADAKAEAMKSLAVAERRAGKGKLRIA